LGVITNGNACVHRLGIGRLFDFALSGEHHAAKPEPLMFRLALEQTGCTPERMIHVGDHPGYDIDAARRLGIRTVWMNIAQAPWPGGPAADAEANSLRGLVAAIDALERRAVA